MRSKGRPDYGRRLLPVVLDELAETEPNRLYAAIPKTADISEGFRDITVADIARAVNFMAKWIEDRFGRTDAFETISYIGIPDLRGAVMFEAAVKCGYKILLPSPRNPASVNISLMEQTGSTKLLHTSEVIPIVKPLQDLHPIHSETIPSFDEMVDSTPQPYPYKKGFDEAKDDPILILHSSGSTGLPKTVTMTHASFAAIDNEYNLPDVPGRRKKDSTVWEFEGEARVFSVFPFFHLGGFFAHTFNVIFRSASPVLGPPHLVPDGVLLKDIMQQQKLRAMFLVPAVIEQVLKEPNGIQFFKDLDFLAFSGAPSSDALGDRLSQVVQLISPFGSTEVFQVAELHLSREDWAWHEFHPHYKHEMQLYDPAERTFELVILADESNKDACALYHNMPGVTEYHTKDLFIQHPEKPRQFKYYGRRDDIIVLSNGEKFNPIPLEAEVQSHPSLQGAMVIGNGRTQASLLVEPNTPLDRVARTQLLENIWPLIEKSNSLVPGQGRIPRGNVICVVPEKPFARTAKGTVVRKLTEQSYKSEIDELYQNSSPQDKIVNVSLRPRLQPIYDQSMVADFVRSILAASFAHGSTIGENEDFFHYGLDSVQTLEITSNLKRNLRGQTSRSVAWISPRTIFRNSTLAGLSRLLAAFLNEGEIPEEDSDITRARAVEGTVAHYMESLPKKPASRATTLKVSYVAIIGSTGYLGSHALLTLLKDSNVTRIYCLNRASNAQQRQEVTLRGLDETVEPLLKKLVYMTVELGKPFLGLAKDQYDLIADEVDIMVYNSWRLDFDLAIHSFSPFLRATCDLVGLSTDSKRNMHIVFISSISSVANMADKEAPEEAVEDPLAAINNGYAQSKLAAERILAAANRQCGTPVSIVRVCQVGGPTNASAGVWADQPWISALIKTSKTLSCVPQKVTPIDWIPVDTVAAMLHDFILNPASQGVQVFNIYPPKSQPWDLLTNVLKETMGIKKTVPMRTWVKKLRGITDPSADDIAKMPALKLLDYYEAFGDGSESMAVSIGRATGISRVRVPIIDKEVLETWLRGWNL